jgi:transcriptional regulator with XRE-family HTH domain
VSASPPIEAVCARVAEILRAERTAQSLSLTRLAEAAALSRQAVSYIEQGKRIPSLDTLLRLTRVLKLDLADVVRRAHRGR